MVSAGKKQHTEIDYIYARYPLWVRYSGLPRMLGPVAWTVFQRLLELRERFKSPHFYYSLERLSETIGLKNRRNMKRILEDLVSFKMINYTTYHGKGKATEFEIIEPLNTPLSEEEVYQLYPKLSSKSYKIKLSEAVEKKEKGISDPLIDPQKGIESPLLEGEGEKGIRDPLIKKEKRISDPLIDPLKGISDPLIGSQKGIIDPPNNKDMYKRKQQQKDLLSGKKQPNGTALSEQENIQEGVVVVSLIDSLKRYGISENQTQRWMKKYPPEYLLEKTKLIEFQRNQGEKIRNPGGMLKRAIEEDWQLPKGFAKKSHREEAMGKEKEEEERREREIEEKVEEWKKKAAPKKLEKIQEKARREVLIEIPNVEERFLDTPIQLRENKIIREEYLRR